MTSLDWNSVARVIEAFIALGVAWITYRNRVLGQKIDAAAAEITATRKEVTATKKEIVATTAKTADVYEEALKAMNKVYRK